MIPNIWTSFKFTGATTPVSLGFIFPSLVALRWGQKGDGLSHGEEHLSWPILIMASMVSVIEVIANIYSIKSKTVLSSSQWFDFEGLLLLVNESHSYTWLLCSCVALWPLYTIQAMKWFSGNFTKVKLCILLQFFSSNFDNLLKSARLTWKVLEGLDHVSDTTNTSELSTQTGQLRVFLIGE